MTRGLPVRWTQRALNDLEKIGDYIALDNPGAALTWVRRLAQRAHEIVEHPMAGRIVPEFGRPELREVFVRNYRIVYLVGNDHVTILTLFEGHRLLMDDPEQE